VQQAITSTSFTEWATEAEPKIRQSLTAAFGVQAGRDAATDALATAWEQWARVSVMDNPIGYVYGIGRNKARRMKTRRQPMFVDVPEQLLPHVEPGLPAAVADLPEQQRIATIAMLDLDDPSTEPADILRGRAQGEAGRRITRRSSDHRAHVVG
jgi:DNA-directed RNA polymerase specialized sigma24 family protein